MDLSLSSIRINNLSANIFKKHVTSTSCTLEPAIQSCDTVQRIPLRQLSIDHNMDVYKDVPYQV